VQERSAGDMYSPNHREASPIMLTDEKVDRSKRNQCWSATWGGGLVIACVLLLTAAFAHAATPKVSSDLQGLRASAHVNVIIQYRQAPTAANHQKVIRQGGALQRELGVVKAGAYSLPGSAIANLAADPDVAYITPDRPVFMHGTVSQTLDYYEATLNTPYGWQLGLDGTGIGVAVIDSGITEMPDLQTARQNRVVYNQNFVGWDANDHYGHGTHVAGILAGDGSASHGPGFRYTVLGVAQNVNIVNLRVLDQNGQGNDSQVIAAIQTAIQLKNTYNIRVINLSLGRPVYESYTQDPLCQAVEQAWQAGIVVVVAAGNDGRDNSANTYGYGTIGAPGNDPYVITVGAMNTLGQPYRTNDVPASYSSKGPTMFDHVVKPDIVAPGNQIISLYQPAFTLNQAYPGNEVNATLLQYGPPPPGNKSGTYFILSGTSMATPMVTGAVALMLEQNPSLTPDQVKARLMKTAYKNLVPYSAATDPVTQQVYNMQADIFTVGAGLLDVQAALTNTDLAPATPGSALSPTVMQDSSGNIVVTNSPALIWGSGVWGNTVVWGVSVIAGNDPAGLPVLWGNTVCWGNTTLGGFGTIWSNTVVWGVGQPQGEASITAINGE